MCCFSLGSVEKAFEQMEQEYGPGCDFWQSPNVSSFLYSPESNIRLDIWQLEARSPFLCRYDIDAAHFYWLLPSRIKSRNVIGKFSEATKKERQRAETYFQARSIRS